MSKKVIITDGNIVEYEICKLVDQYDPILRKPTLLVDWKVLPATELAYIVLSLMKSVEHYNGLGLSANQCGIPYRICVINHLDDKKIYSLINPTIIEKSHTVSKYKEGCLSFPGLFLQIGRPEWCVVEYQTVSGERMTKKFEGIWATCVQHELDHLNGICYTDLVSPIKLEIAKRKVAANLRKIRRATTGA